MLMTSDDIIIKNNIIDNIFNFFNTMNVYKKVKSLSMTFKNYSMFNIKYIIIIFNEKI